jgi:hypothetical protein
MRITSKQFYFYYKTIIIISILLTLVFKKNILIIYFVTITLFIPSVINYFVYQLKFKDLLLKKFPETDNIDLASKTLEKSQNLEIEEMRLNMLKRVRLAFFSFFYIIFLLIVMMFVI